MLSAASFFWSHFFSFSFLQVSRMQGKAHVVELLDALYAHAERRLSEFDVNDWSAAEQVPPLRTQS